MIISIHTCLIRSVAESFYWRLSDGNPSNALIYASRDLFLYGDNVNSFGFVADTNYLFGGKVNIYINTPYTKCKKVGNKLIATQVARGGDNIIGTAPLSDGSTVNIMAISRSTITLEKAKGSDWKLTSTDIVAITFQTILVPPQ